MFFVCHFFILTVLIKSISLKIRHNLLFVQIRLFQNHLSALTPLPLS